MCIYVCTYVLTHLHPAEGGPLQLRHACEQRARTLAAVAVRGAEVRAHGRVEGVRVGTQARREHTLEPRGGLDRARLRVT